METAKVLTLAELVQCFHNWEDLAKALSIPSLIFRTKSGKIKAATKL